MSDRQDESEPPSAADSSPPAPFRGDPHDPYAAWRHPGFRLYLVGNLFAIHGMQMQNTAVTWEIYELTNSKLALAWVGLVQVVPVVLLTLLAGHAADRFSRKRIIGLSLAVVVAASLALTWFSHRAASLASEANVVDDGGMAWLWSHNGSVAGMFLCLFFNGVARAFLQPAKSSFLPQIVPRECFSNAVAWNTGGFQLSSAIGPALAGLLIAVSGGARMIYLLDALLSLSFLTMLAFVRTRPVARSMHAFTLRSLGAGVAFLWRNQVILGAMLLDMFAVLLGGAVALLPVYQKDILLVGPAELGWLRAAPAVGAFLSAIMLAHLPPLERSGRTLLWSVAGFGAATIVFGVSTSLPLSLAMLFLTGAFDQVSVVIRHTLVQLLTPDEMRGRVSAVNGMCISISNELGEFESGMVAHLFSPIISVVSGGVGTLLIVLGTAVRFPRLRDYGRLVGPIKRE